MLVAKPSVAKTKRKYESSTSKSTSSNGRTGRYDRSTQQNDSNDINNDDRFIESRRFT